MRSEVKGAVQFGRMKGPKELNDVFWKVTQLLSRK